MAIRRRDERREFGPHRSPHALARKLVPTKKGVPTIQEAGRKMGKRVALFAFFCEEGGRERDEWMSELGEGGLPSLY